MPSELGWGEWQITWGIVSQRFLEVFLRGNSYAVSLGAFLQILLLHFIVSKFHKYLYTLRLFKDLSTSFSPSSPVKNAMKN